MSAYGPNLDDDLGQPWIDHDPELSKLSEAQRMISIICGNRHVPDPMAWVKFMRHCAKIGHGEIKNLKIRHGVPKMTAQEQPEEAIAQ